METFKIIQFFKWITWNEKVNVINCDFLYEKSVDIKILFVRPYFMVKPGYQWVRRCCEYTGVRKLLFWQEKTL